MPLPPIIRQRTGEKPEFTHAGDTIGAKLMISFFLLERWRYIFLGKPPGRVLCKELFFC
jgi:hypothetical protein